MSYNPHRKVGVFYCATTNYSTARATCDFVWKKVYDTYWGRGKPRQNYRQDDKVVFLTKINLCYITLNTFQTNFKSPKVVHPLLQNVDKLWITFFVSGVVGNTFLITFVSLNQTNYETPTHS